MTKTLHFHWENRFVLQMYGAVRKLYQFKSTRTLRNTVYNDVHS